MEEKRPQMRLWARRKDDDSEQIYSRWAMALSMKESLIEKSLIWKIVAFPLASVREDLEFAVHDKCPLHKAHSKLKFWFQTYFEKKLPLIFKKKSREPPPSSHGIFFSTNTVSWNSDVSNKASPSKWPVSLAKAYDICMRSRNLPSRVHSELCLFWQNTQLAARKHPVRTPVLPTRNTEHGGKEHSR